MTYYVGTMPVGEHLSHHGVKGMKWGQRRYQNPDGSLTAAGRVRYGVSNAYSRASGFVKAKRAESRARGQSFYKKHKKAIKTAAGVVGTAAAVAGAAYLGKRYGKGAVKAVGRAAKGLRRTKFQPNTLSRYGSVRNRVNRGLNNANDFFKGTRGAIKRRAKSIKNDFGSIKRTASNATIRGRQNWYAAKAARADARSAAKSTLSLNNGFRNKANRAANNIGTKVKDFSNRFRKGYKAKSGVVGSSGRLGGKKAVNTKGAKQARYPGWMKDTAKAYAGSAKRTAGKAKDKVKSTAKRYNDYMNGDSRFVKSVKLGVDARTGRMYTKANNYTRREYARTLGKSFAKGVAIGAAPYAATAGVIGVANAAYKRKLKKQRQKKKSHK